MNTFRSDLNIDIAALADRFSTPLFIYSVPEIKRRMAILLGALPEGSQLLYSVKANPNPWIIRILDQAGLGFEVASAGELLHLIKLKINPGKIILGGPVKSKEALSAGLQHNILAYNIESEQDLFNLIHLSKQPGNIMLRINPDFSNRNSELKMGGVSSQFGIDEKDVIPLVRKYQKVVNINGLFMFAGSQFFNSENIIQNTSFIIDFAETHKNEFEQLDFLDFGGGFGVSESADQPDLDIRALTTGLAELFHNKKPFLGEITGKFFESGRFLTETSAILVSRILDIKYSKGKKYIILDTGLNHLGLRQLNHRIRKPSIHAVAEIKNYEPAILTGPTCTPLDVIQGESDFPDVSIGDLVYIENVGAYTATLAPGNFCGFTNPTEILADINGDITLMKERGDVENSLGTGYLM